MRTELRLAVSYKGWEYTVLRKDTSQTSRASGQDIYVMVSPVAVPPDLVLCHMTGFQRLNSHKVPVEYSSKTA